MIFTEAYNELSFYTLSHPDKDYFIHQHIVDAQTAQTADVNAKNISVVFALAGLYLAIEKNYTGKQVQEAHMQLAKNKNSLPRIDLPLKRGDITAEDVLHAAPGQERDDRIMQWCASVWEGYKHLQNAIAQYTIENLSSL